MKPPSPARRAIWRHSAVCSADSGNSRTTALPARRSRTPRGGQPSAVQATVPARRIDQRIGGLPDGPGRAISAAQPILQRVGLLTFGCRGARRLVAVAILRIDPLEQRRQRPQQFGAIHRRQGVNAGDLVSAPEAAAGGQVDDETPEPGQGGHLAAQHRLLG